jgi:signal transduction histidine kinase
MLYFLAALISSYFKGLLSRSAQDLEKKLDENREIQRMSEDNRRALMNVMEDLTKARDELEIRVKQRTAELEDAKKNLEVRVKERTSDLEESRKAILHMLRDLREDVDKLKEVDRMKNEFISVVSHELRTPLTPLMDYASILLEGMVGPYNEKQKEIFQSLLRLSKRELNLINSLLDISRLEVGIYKPNKVPIQLGALIQDSLMDIKKDADEKKLSVSVEIQEKVSTIMADENLIARLIAQLINNALKFTPEGGSIKIKCSTEDNNVRFEITDTGIGIAADKLPRIFEKFFQADSSYARKFGGMGLGLAICKQIVEVHNGKIWVESEGLGRGTKFTFTLPIKG